MTPSTDRRIRDEIGSADARRSGFRLLPEITVQQGWDLISDTDLLKRFGNGRSASSTWIGYA